MRLEYFLPSPRFQPIVSVHAAISGLTELRVETLPAMLPNIHIRLAGSCSYVFPDGRVEPAPRIAVIGQTGSAYRMVLSQDFRMVAMGVLPAGWAALFREPAHICADRIIDGAALWRESAVERLLDRLDRAPLDGTHISLIEAFLDTHIGELGLRRAAHIAAIDQWLERSRSLSIDRLSESLDVSRRQVQRTALELYGTSPKTLAMKYRALRAAATLTLDGSHGMDAAQMAYADQAHFIRDFRRFIGWTPGTFVRERQNIAAATMAGRRTAGAVRPLVLWS